MDFNKCALGIEFGSTRIKAILVDCGGKTIASGSFEWENSLINGLFTYSQEEMIIGMQTAYKNLKQDAYNKFNKKITILSAIGISGMMHGYMPFDKDGNLLTAFRTWRNTNTAKAAKILCEELNFNIPLRWSISHLYQAILDKEDHVADIDHIATLAVYIHKLLTGNFVVGVGEASGMFPIDSKTRNYHQDMLNKANALIASTGKKLEDLLPKVLVAGDFAGTLTESGAKLLDVDGDLQAGIPFAPPEGDAGTGMVATNAIAVGTGNISVGTSCFSMIVLDGLLTKPYEEIDIVTTPCGDDVAMVHCNNCTSEINAWARIIKEITGSDDVYSLIFNKADQGEYDCGGVCSCNYISGEPLTGIEKGVPLVSREADSNFTFANFARSLVYSAIATLKLGMDILMVKESINIERITGHGGFFKTEGVGAKILASAIGTPVTVAQTAGEGGAWGMAILALYTANKKGDLSEFLNNIFSSVEEKVYDPDNAVACGFATYMSNFSKILKAEKAITE